MSAIAGLLVAGWPRWRPPWRGPACCCTSQPPSSPPPPGCRTTSSWVSNTQYPNDIGENKTVKLRSPVQYPSCAARYLDIWAVHTWWSAAGAFSGDYPRMSRPPPRCCRRSVTRTRCWAHAGSWSTRGLTQIFFLCFEGFLRLPWISRQKTRCSFSLSVVAKYFYRIVHQIWDRVQVASGEYCPGVWVAAAAGLRGPGEDDWWLVSAAERKYSLYHFSLIPGDRQQRGRDNRVFVLKWELERQGQPRLARSSNVYL